MTTTRASILATAAAVLGVAALTAVPAMAEGPGPMYQNQPQHYGYNYDHDSLGGCWIWMNGARHWSFNCGTSGALYYGEPDYYGGPGYYAGPTFGFSFGDGPYYRHHWHR